MNTSTDYQTAYEQWIIKKSSQLPEKFNCLDLHQIVKQVDEFGMLGRWLYVSEIATIAHQQNVLRSSKVHMLKGAMAFPFAMLDPGEPLVLGEYAVEPHLPSMDANWYRIRLHEANASESPARLKELA